MSRSYWSIVLALIGWLTLSAQTPQPKAEPHQKNSTARAQSAAQPIRPVRVEIINQPTEPGGYHDPCKHDESDARSDLCAQWTAAHGASNAAYYAWIQLWAAAAGMAGLLVTILLTHRAVKAARDAVSVAQATAQRQLRAYMALNHCGYYGFSTRGRRITVSLALINNGQTPALRYRSSWIFYVAPTNADPLSVPRQVLAKEGSHIIGPGRQNVFVKRPFRKLNAVEVAGMKDGTLSLFLVGRFVYTDVFGRRYDGEIALRNHPNLVGGMFKNIYAKERRRN